MRAATHPVHFSGNGRPSPEIHSFPRYFALVGPDGNNPATKGNNRL